MVIHRTRNGLGLDLENMKRLGKKVGFVPTMGALHAGHLSLVERAKRENDVIVVSIFVNPTQFTNQEDLKHYPRTFESDKAALESAHTDFLFYPSVEEMYPPEDNDYDQYQFGSLETVMEGKFRPGHFKGVAQVVSKLFKIVQPDSAYFGEKDFQQLAIIRDLVTQMKSPVQIIGCPTIREQDGLALSSRNSLLTSEEKQEAAKISKALFYIRDHQRDFSVEELKRKAIDMIEQSGKMKVEYVEIADEKTLQPVKDQNNRNRVRSFAAVKNGNVRLIDNVAL